MIYTRERYHARSLPKGGLPPALEGWLRQEFQAIQRGIPHPVPTVDLRDFDVDPRGLNSSRAGMLNALGQAGSGVVVAAPGTYEVETGLPFSGASATLVGPGTKDMIIRASTPSGYVIDLTGWTGPVSNNHHKIPFGGFRIQGDGAADATLAHGGLNAYGAVHMRLFNIGIQDTGGPALRMGNQWGIVAEDVVLTRPVGADTNDVPYFLAANWLNACVFVGLGFRSALATADGSSVLLIEDGAVSGLVNPATTHDTLFLAPWFEFQHTPENGTLIDIAADGVTIQDPQFFDLSTATTNTTETSHAIFRATDANAGGNEWRGVVPGRGTSSSSYAYGIIDQQGRNRIAGPRGFRDNNVRFDSGVEYSYVELAGSRSGTGTATSVVDNSGEYTNVVIDHTQRKHTIGGATFSGGDQVGAAGNPVLFVVDQPNTASRRGFAVKAAQALTGVVSRFFTVLDSSDAEVFGIGHQGVTRFGFLHLAERSAPGTPVADTAYFYLRDIGGKTTLCMKGPDGLEVTIAAQGDTDSPLAGPQAPGADFTIATGRFGLHGRRLTLSGTQRATLAGTAQLCITGASS